MNKLGFGREILGGTKRAGGKNSLEENRVVRGSAPLSRLNKKNGGGEREKCRGTPAKKGP